MPENEEIIEKGIVETNQVNDKTVVDFGYLLNIIIGYYSELEGEPPLEGDEWKKNTDSAEAASKFVPEDIDKKVKEAFISQIDKFIDKNDA